MNSKKKVVILKECQVKSLMDNLRVERDKRILSELKNQILKVKLLQTNKFTEGGQESGFKIPHLP